LFSLSRPLCIQITHKVCSSLLSFFFFLSVGIECTITKKLLVLHMLNIQMSFKRHKLIVICWPHYQKKCLNINFPPKKWHVETGPLWWFGQRFYNPQLEIAVMMIILSAAEEKLNVGSFTYDGMNFIGILAFEVEFKLILR